MTAPKIVPTRYIVDESDSTPSDKVQLEQFSDDELIAELARRRPELVVAPRIPTSIMCLRGGQASPIFEYQNIQGQDGKVDQVGDSLFDYLEDMPAVPEFDGTNDPLHHDDRPSIVAFAVWKAMIAGMEEWVRYRSKEGDTSMVMSWLRPFEFNHKVIES